MAPSLLFTLLYGLPSLIVVVVAYIAVIKSYTGSSEDDS